MLLPFETLLCHFLNQQKRLIGFGLVRIPVIMQFDGFQQNILLACRQSEARQDLHEVAGPVAVVELGREDLVPRVAAGAGGARQRGEARDPPRLVDAATKEERAVCDWTGPTRSSIPATSGVVAGNWRASATLA